ncbi:MAG: hypothetical protein HBSAPP03_00920 [Phycisphaerae bacterium]|nr:MAG: hypothetical protein HBSAPP03_00920 [Phycisphaerae bacterium]
MNTPRPTETPAAPDVSSAADRFERLLHELRTLLDASRALLDHATRSLEGGRAPTTTSAVGIESDLAGMAQRLERMAELVQAGMQSASKPLGSPALTRARPVTLGDAVDHAIDVLTPMAQTHQARLACAGGPLLKALPAGALYTVVLNALQNGIEAVAARGGPGTVTLTLRPDVAPEGVGYGRDGRDWFVLDVADDGVGPPQNAARCFDLGVTTKPRGAGVGLAVARSVVQGMGGTIELLPRPHTGGALLRVRFPSLANVATLTLGGAA